MEETNLMTEEIVEDAVEEIAKAKSGLSTPLAMLIGSGLTLAAIVGYKQLKKVLANKKAEDQTESIEIIDCVGTESESEENYSED